MGKTDHDHTVSKRGGGGSIKKTKPIELPKQLWRSALATIVPMSDEIPGAHTHIELVEKLQCSPSTICKAKRAGKICIVGYRYYARAGGGVRKYELLLPTEEVKRRKLKIYSSHKKND
jgi:hypothetical protein